MKAKQHRTAVIVGGAGAMGRWAVRSIAKLGTVERLYVADIDEERAKLVADEVGGPCTPIALDATDEAAMRSLFAECDVVLNTMGPFSIFARKILETAIDCGCDYLDIDDDWESTIEAFEFDEAARAKGVRVIKGIGGSPGYSNLAAMLAVSRLDTVEEIFTGWSQKGAVTVPEDAYPTTGSASAALEHWLIQISGTIRCFRDGEYQDVAPLQPVHLTYPGVGPVTLYTVGHPEAVTLPRHVPGLIRSTNVSSGPAWVFDHARTVAAAYDAGEITLAEGARQFENSPAPAERGPRDPLTACWAMAIGERDGQRLAISVDPAGMAPGKMGGGTGLPLAIGLDLLRRGGFDQPGVHTPEEAFDPAEFFDIYRQFLDLEEGQDAVVVQELADPPRVVFG